MTVHGNADLARAQRAIARGLKALGRRVPELIDFRWDTDAPDGSPLGYRGHRERTQRAHLQALEVGRELIARGRELELQAEQAKRDGVEVLRNAWPAEPWTAIGELLGLTRAGAHKRYRDVEGPEPQLTIDDAIAEGIAAVEAQTERPGPPVTTRAHAATLEGR